MLSAQAVRATELTLQAPGAPEKLTEQLTAASLVLAAARRDDAPTPQDLLAAARADYARMVGVLYGAGLYGGDVKISVDGREAAEIDPLSRIDRIERITITVLAGPKFTFSQASVTPLAPGTALPEGFAVGKTAEVGMIEAATTAGINGWREAGHAKADLESQTIYANHDIAMLAADIRLRPGPRLRFGDLLVTETGRVRPDRIREIAGLPTGEVYTPEEVREAADRLRRTGAFRSVALQEAEEIGPGNTLDIEAQVADERPRRIGVGAELSSLEGITLSGFWLHRNLFGGAERFRVEAELGGIGGESGGMDYSLSARLDRPATFTRDTGLFLGFSLAEQDEPDYRERSAQIGAGLTHLFSDELSGEAAIGYRYSEVDDDLGSRTLEHVLFPLRATWDTRDDPLNAKDGAFVDVHVTPFAGVNGSASGTRLYTDARGFLGFGENDRFVLAGRAQIGSVSGAAATEVPPAMLFYSGGAGTVRGQPYQSLSVDLGAGRSIGGRSFLALSGELRAEMRYGVSLVGFYDLGFVGADSWGSENGDWHSGAGLGLRYDTGIGPIRLDVATALDNKDSGGIEVYIGIGQAF
ncbi:autotransporter secretion outer membrane protein TamA [Roseovarius litoreus]|uniref:Autotransporter secretion outer membrane protein TamA n=2 Tax=Roseovarius litoreus TaxID=1155722 RepID=A0A1M7D822_9RHOB|nr:autotransporter secretion outer membrane protein TamA [Roseovarius litoreus]